MNKANMKIFVISALMVALLSLAACSSATLESAPTATKDQQTDVYVPVVEKGFSESDDLASREVSEAYPDLEPETQTQEVEVIPLHTAYPESELDDDSLVDRENSQEEAIPVTPEEPVQIIKPTPRGDELVATDPSTVILASGKFQLVELFAFW